jgi:predicted Ser/Thr protein kinase
MADEGKVLDGRYRIVRALGAGGFGKTYLAQDTRRPGLPQCVVKQLRLVSTDTQLLEIARRLFNTEAETLQKLGSHSQIPELLAYFEQEQEFYLVQEFIPGQPLSKELQNGQVLSEAQVVRLLEEGLNVLTFVHGNGVIHRDIKPDNLMRHQEDGRIVLIDFGAVKSIGTQLTGVTGNAPLTVSIGTSGYMPSEQAAGTPRLSSDIYALGMVAIQALTGVHPADIEQNDKNGDLKWPSEAKVNPVLKAILLKMVRYNFSHRYQSASAVLSDVKKLSANNPTGVIVGQRAETVINAAQDLASKAGQSLVTAAEVSKEPVKAALSKGGKAGAQAGAFVLSATGGFLGSAGNTLWNWIKTQLAKVPKRFWWLSGTTLVVAGGIAAYVVTRPPKDPYAAAVIDPSPVEIALRATRQKLVTSRSQPKTVFGQNLIVNGNAEASDGVTALTDLAVVPGWSLSGNFTTLQYNIPNALIGATDPGPDDRGRSVFVGGANNALSSASQTIDISVGATTIDQGSVSYELSGYLGGYKGEADNAALKLTFQDQSGKVLAEAALGPVAPSDRSYGTKLISQDIVGTVPVGTRSIEVQLLMTRSGTESYNHAFADNLSVILSGPPFADITGIAGSKEITQLAQLGVFPSDGGNFMPQQSVTRAEFVRWLVLANNAYNVDKPTRQIRLAEGGNATFTDIPTTHPDFKYIQGMANAGFTIGVDPTTFSPDTPLTREQMIAIKVGLDQGGLDVPSSDYIPAWTDRDQISPAFKPALEVEYARNTQVKNVERTFGAIKTFNPQAAVTRAQATLCIWLIGNSEPRSAEDALKMRRQGKR